MMIDRSRSAERRRIRALVSARYPKKLDLSWLRPTQLELELEQLADQHVRSLINLGMKPKE